MAVNLPEAVFFEDRLRGDVLLKEEVTAGMPFTLTVRDGDKVVWEKQLVTEGKALRLDLLDADGAVVVDGAKNFDAIELFLRAAWGLPAMR